MSIFGRFIKFIRSVRGEDNFAQLIHEGMCR